MIYKDSEIFRPFNVNLEIVDNIMNFPSLGETQSNIEKNTHKTWSKQPQLETRKHRMNSELPINDAYTAKWK